MTAILTVIAPLFLIIFVSALLQKFYNLGADWATVLNKFALKIGLPVLIFSALSKTPISYFEHGGLLIANSAFLIISLVLALIIGKILRLKKEMHSTLFICFSFGNVAYLGIPILSQVYGETILSTASLIVAVYLFWLFSLGIGYLNYSIETNKKAVFKNTLKNLLKNPLLISVILGILIGSLKIPLPAVILKSLDMITASVTPTVLIVIGLFIGQSKIGKLTEWIPVLFYSFIKLAALPALFYFSAQFLGIGVGSSIIQAAMPLAITPFALADQYNLDKTFIARSIVLSTILSAISLPFWISIL